ncbi:cytochrome P450, partial [Striga asiatica]
MIAPLAIIIIYAFLAIILSSILLALAYKLWWAPLHIQHKLGSQGIKGPSYKFLHGSTKELMSIKKMQSSKKPVDLSSHDIFPTILPHFYTWMKLYAMIDSVEAMLDNWKNYEGKEIDVCSDFKVLTSEVISRSAFGSSYVEGRKIFEMLSDLYVLISRNMHTVRFFGIGKLLRTEDEIEADKIEKFLHDSIMGIVKKRQDDVKTNRALNFGNDFLGSLLKSHHELNPKKQISAAEIVDECKTFYFAGQETTTGLLLWSILLLAIHTEWQEKARNEVNMILLETMRLYSPATSMSRMTKRKVKLGKYELPANVELHILLHAVHRNPKIWGHNAHLFRPERFSEGLAKATNGNATAFLGFGFGPRFCVGMNFANNEAKIALSMILQRYKFTLSGNYVHSPYVLLTTQPQHGNNSNRLLSHTLARNFATMIALLPAISVFLAILLVIPLLTAAYKLWWAPLHLQHKMRSQGIRGPSYKIFHGTSKELIKFKNQTNKAPMDYSTHDIFPIIQPHLYSWMKLYGNNFVHWMGTQPYLVVTEPDLIKEILSNRENFYPKPKIKGYLTKLLGDGIVRAEGEKWLKLRKLANHAFHGECLKDMVPAKIASVEAMLDNWKNYEGKEIEVCSEFKVLTSEVISRTAFGSSYVEGRKIFNLLRDLGVLISKNAYNIRFFGTEKFVRTHDDIEADRVEKLLHDSIMEIVKKRQDEVKTGGAHNFGNDFLGSLLKSHDDMGLGGPISAAEIIDECKTFYFAGQETSYSLLSWSVLLLAIQTDWQEKARNEVIELFGRESPNSEGLARLKIVNMIIYETLRLYSPVTIITRRTDKKVKLGKYEIPPNVILSIAPLALHRNPELWGQEAHFFRPERFSEGLAKATNGNATAFLGFGFGPRICVGMNFASNEAKIALSMILQRYKFTLSANYVHSPDIFLTTQPQHGVKILLQPLNFATMIALLAIFVFLAILLLIPLLTAAYKLWWTPLHLQHKMMSQGIRGPSYKFFHGSSKELIKFNNQTNKAPMNYLTHDIFPIIQPHLYSWMKLYGNNFVHWMGTQPYLVVTELDLIKEILINRESFYPKTKLKGYLKKLLGDGIVMAEGEKWFKLRKLANHAFHGECLKDMIPAMIASVEAMLDNWKNYEGKEIDVCSDFKVLTSEVISRTAFGSSYVEGRKIFNLLRDLCTLISKNAFNIRFFVTEKFVRTKEDIEADRVEKLLHDSIMELVNKRRDEVKMGRAQNFGNDFLGSLLKSHDDMGLGSPISAAEIIDECKTFYFAGQETTYSLLSWSVMFLAIHTDWQEKARNEVLELFGLEKPNSESLARLKIVKLGKFEIPANVNLSIPPLALHRNPEIWGQDAHLFKPERFSEGLAKATNGNAIAFLGFGFGPRICVGMNFASNEAKIALSMILQRYKFTLSGNYVHSPDIFLTTQPKYGVKILLQP